MEFSFVACMRLWRWRWHRTVFKHKLWPFSPIPCAFDCMSFIKHYHFSEILIVFGGPMRAKMRRRKKRMWSWKEKKRKRRINSLMKDSNRPSHVFLDIIHSSLICRSIIHHSQTMDGSSCRRTFYAYIFKKIIFNPAYALIVTHIADLLCHVY